MHSPEWLRTYLALQGLLAPALDALWCGHRLPAPRVVFAELQRRLEATGLAKQLIRTPDSLDASYWTCDVVYWRDQFLVVCTLSKQTAPCIETVLLRVHRAESFILSDDFERVWSSPATAGKWSFSRIYLLTDPALDCFENPHDDHLCSAAWLSNLCAELSTVMQSK